MNLFLTWAMLAIEVLVMVGVIVVLVTLFCSLGLNGVCLC